MQSVTSKYLRECEGSKTLNILTFPTHERYETLLAKTGHNFYAWQHPQLKEWRTDYANIPPNYVILDKNRGDNQIPLYLDIDLVLSQSKFGQYQVGKQIAARYDLPFFCLEHTLPHPQWTEEQMQEICSRKGDINIYISEFSIPAWRDNEGEQTKVVHHGVDTDLFSSGRDRDVVLLSVVNDWQNRNEFCGFNLWQQVSNGLPIRVVGDNPGLSEPAKDVNELVKAYQSSAIFLNTSQVSPVPTALLEAMACGCAIVTTGTCMIPEIIENGVNGLMSNEPEVLREYCNLLLRNKELREELGRAAKETIVKNFSEEKFVETWKEILWL